MTTETKITTRYMLPEIEIPESLSKQIAEAMEREADNLNREFWRRVEMCRRIEHVPVKYGGGFYAKGVV